MSKRPPLGSQFQKLDALKTLPTSKSMTPEIAFNERKHPALKTEAARVSDPSTPVSSSIVEESVSKMDSVQFGECSKQTLSTADTVHSGHCQKRTVSNLDTVEGEHDERVQRPTGNFTAVPHELLRGEVKFRDPLDFMIYMHMYSYSYGFGRPTATMGQAQLERFTGAAKNTIKRSMERLIQDGWITMIGEFEHARLSRKWRVRSPADYHGPKPGVRVSNPDSVQNGQCPERIPTLSKLDTVTVSKFDPYKEREHKEKSKKALSLVQTNFCNEANKESELLESLKQYFAEVKPERKRRNEKTAFVELRADFSQQDIFNCLAQLLDKGLPRSGEACHSPMAFLASGGIAQVLSEVAAASETNMRTDHNARIREEEEMLKRKDAEREALDFAEQERRFLTAFPTKDEQTQIVAQYAKRFPMLKSDGQFARNLAISAWWEHARQTTGHSELAM